MAKKFWPLVFWGPRQKIVCLCKAGYPQSSCFYIISAASHALWREGLKNRILRQAPKPVRLLKACG